jgi:hypothetical protein
MMHGLAYSPWPPAYRGRVDGAPGREQWHQ